VSGDQAGHAAADDRDPHAAGADDVAGSVKEGSGPARRTIVSKRSYVVVMTTDQATVGGSGKRTVE